MAGPTYFRPKKRDRELRQSVDDDSADRGGRKHKPLHVLQEEQDDAISTVLNCPELLEQIIARTDVLSQKIYLVCKQWYVVYRHMLQHPQHYALPVYHQEIDGPLLSEYWGTVSPITHLCHGPFVTTTANTDVLAVGLHMYSFGSDRSRTTLRLLFDHYGHYTLRNNRVRVELCPFRNTDCHVSCYVKYGWQRSNLSLGDVVQVMRAPKSSNTQWELVRPHYHIRLSLTSNLLFVREMVMGACSFNSGQLARYQSIHPSGATDAMDWLAPSVRIQRKQGGKEFCVAWNGAGVPVAIQLAHFSSQSTCAGFLLILMEPQWPLALNILSWQRTSLYNVHYELMVVRGGQVRECTHPDPQFLSSARVAYEMLSSFQQALTAPAKLMSFMERVWGVEYVLPNVVVSPHAFQPKTNRSLLQRISHSYLNPAQLMERFKECKGLQSVDGQVETIFPLHHVLCNTNQPVAPSVK